MAERRIPAGILCQHWVHSHEEDTETEMVFRPASHPFPRSRGRRSFELRPDGTFVEGPSGAERLGGIVLQLTTTAFDRHGEALR